jgi:hypothetical protein
MPITGGFVPAETVLTNSSKFPLWSHTMWVDQGPLLKPCINGALPLGK